MTHSAHTFVGVNVVNKTCSKCKKTKDIDLFYICQGKHRSECKACTIKKNVAYQREVKTWKNRFVDNDEQRSYMVEYYAKNKEKFAEYRKQFKVRYPEYYKEYARNRKSK